jgi:hypothetical protein
MKVKIGPYTNWFGPYQLAEKLMFWVPKEKDEYGFEHTADRVHKFGEWLAHGNIMPEPTAGDIHKWGDRPHTWLYKFLSWIHSKQERTVKVHIDRWDTWSMDHTLAYIVLPMLKQLKETKHGAPYVENSDVPEELQSTVHEKLDYHKEGKTDAKFFERWDWVLDEMIFAFETKVDDGRWEEQFETGESDLQWKKLEDGNYQMVKGPNDTREYDWEGRKEYQERISNGFRLFGKYYESLWD